MGLKRISTDLVEEIRLPIGGSFIVTDELGNELFRITATGDAVQLGGVTVSPTVAGKLAAVTGAAIAAGTQAAHLADIATNATGTQIATAVNGILDVLEAFGQAATS